MDATEQATDQIARIVLLGTEYTVRLTGTGAKNLAALIAASAKGTQRTKGKVRLESLLKSGRPLTVFEHMRDDVARFSEEAKRYGIHYTVVTKAEGAREATVDVLVKADDAGRVNRIFEKLKLATVDKAALKDTVEAIKTGKTGQSDKIPETAASSEQKSQEAESLIDDLLAKDTGKEEGNPTTAKMEKSPPSEHSSDRGSRSAEGTDREGVDKGAGDTEKQAPKDKQDIPEERRARSRRSVRKEMDEIRRERKEAQTAPRVPEQTQHIQPARKTGKTKTTPEKGR
jgi:hypothetical protein